jgi:hypothetical protein
MNKTTVLFAFDNDTSSSYSSIVELSALLHHKLNTTKHLHLIAISTTEIFIYNIQTSKLEHTIAQKEEISCATFLRRQILSIALDRQVMLMNLFNNTYLNKLDVSDAIIELIAFGDCLLIQSEMSFCVWHSLTNTVETIHTNKNCIIRKIDSNRFVCQNYRAI